MANENKLAINQQIIDIVEPKVDGADSDCGGKVTLKDDLMLCDKCGYNASVKIDEETFSKLLELSENA